MKNIVITGSSGLVGSNFIHFLSRNPEFSKYRLFSLYNSNKTCFKNCENIKIDITNYSEVMSLSKINPGFIIHSAALTGIKFCEEHEELAQDINIKGTMNVVELARKTKSKLVYLSTDAVFDGKKGNYSENDKPNPVNVYGKTKLEGEEICIGYDNAVIVRMSVFGKNLVANKKSFLENAIYHLKNKMKFNAFYDVRNSLIYVKNALDIIMMLYKKDAKGIYHIGASESQSKYEFVNLVAETFGFDKRLIKKISVDSIIKKEKVNLSKDCSFNLSKMRDFLGLKSLPSVRDMLLDFKSGYTTRWDK